MLTAGGTAPNFNHTAFNFATQQPVTTVCGASRTWAWAWLGLQYAAYQRNRTSNPAQAAAHLNAVDWSLNYYEHTSSNPDYEVLTPFGAYTAARMNAEHGRNYDVQKLVNWVFSRSNARPTKTMITRRAVGWPRCGRADGIYDPEYGKLPSAVTRFR